MWYDHLFVPAVELSAVGCRAFPVAGACIWDQGLLHMGGNEADCLIVQPGGNKSPWPTYFFVWKISVHVHFTEFLSIIPHVEFKTIMSLELGNGTTGAAVRLRAPLPLPTLVWTRADGHGCDKELECLYADSVEFARAHGTVQCSNIIRFTITRLFWPINQSTIILNWRLTQT